MTGINRNVEGKTTRIIARYSGSARWPSATTVRLVAS